MSTVAESLAHAARQLAAASESPRLDAELLLGKVLARSRSGLLVDGDRPLGADQAIAYAALLAQRIAGMPVAYLVGEREFWSLPLAVTPAVLVPRPETEMLVEAVLAAVPAGTDWRILDLGTGSGAIALALASERPQARITATDLSADALAVAVGNARRLGCAAIDWRLGAWFDAVPGERFDVIVSNPPYVADDDRALHALRAEPRLALTPGSTGLEAFALIIAGAKTHLRGAGLLALEHGSDQGAAVAALLARSGFVGITRLDDRSGRPRVTFAHLQSTPDSISPSFNQPREPS
jgi:release factor glutamine methyltransferase